MNEFLKKYSNIFKQIKDCKYPDITIEIDDYPLYNRSNIHIIIRAKGNPWYSKYVTSSKCPYYKALCEEELQKSQILMIGDASGKPGDFSDSDKKCAENFGIDYIDVRDFLEL